MADFKQRVPSPTRRNLSKPIADPRALALEILDRLEAADTTLDSLLDEAAALTAGLSRRDRALFNQLVYGVLRWRLRLDAVIDAYASRPLSKIAPRVRNILRLGLFQIRFMDRIPPSAAVNTAVGLAKAGQASKASGFINAVLRNAIRSPDRFRLPAADQDIVAHLAVSQSVPRWLVSRWIERLGKDEALRLCEAINAIPPISLRCNQLKNSLPELEEALGPDATEIRPLAAVPGALNLAGPRCPIHHMQAFIDGRFAVQDGAAQLVSLLLDPQPGECVLDACAGLGGKTTHIAQLMDNRGRIVALDHIRAKLERLEKEARRLGAVIIELRRLDLNREIDPQDLPVFDRILLDAPCSGLGVLRRNPDAKWSARKKDIAYFAKRQIRFLNRLAPLVKPQGVIVFAVCSMEPEENERVVFHFLKNHPNFAISSTQSTEEKSVRPFLDADGFLRTAPHIDRLDGFFAARMIRTY